MQRTAGPYRGRLMSSAPLDRRCRGSTARAWQHWQPRRASTPQPATDTWTCRRPPPAAHLSAASSVQLLRLARTPQPAPYSRSMRSGRERLRDNAATATEAVKARSLGNCEGAARRREEGGFRTQFDSQSSAKGTRGVKRHHADTSFATFHQLVFASTPVPGH